MDIRHRRARCIAAYTPPLPPPPSSAEADYVVVGGGIGGLAVGALLAEYGKSVCVFESHYRAGGCAHGFRVGGYSFDTGPSLFSGFADKNNPLCQLFITLGISVPTHKYDTWGVLVPEGRFDAPVGQPAQFARTLRNLRGKAAADEFHRLQRAMQSLGAASVAVPAAAARADAGALLTTAPFLPRALARHARELPLLSAPFSRVMDEVVGVRDEFLRNWIDLLCFLLAGVPARRTPTAEMAFMFREFYREGATLEYPVGGADAIADALVRALEARGGKLYLRTHVQRILTAEDGSGAVCGVQLRGGERVRARRKVISNASLWDTRRMLRQDGNDDNGDDGDDFGVKEGGAETPTAATTPAPLPSFMHLHAGFESPPPPSSSSSPMRCHYIVVDDWQRLTEPQNVVAISIPSVLDASLAPFNHHSLHAYTPATEPFDEWAALRRGTAEYKAKKEQRGRVLWRAVERAVPGFDRQRDVRVGMLGTPLTHRFWLRKHRGTYGAAPLLPLGTMRGALGGGNGEGDARTPDGLVLAGENSFPGIGVPAVAASALLAANAQLGAREHLQRVRALGLL